VKYSECNMLDLVKHEWEELSLIRGVPITEFDKRLCNLHMKLEWPQPMSAAIVANVYGDHNHSDNRCVYKHLVHEVDISVCNMSG
jgi:hypothetical protein